MLNANVSHEMNTPINCIINFVDILIHKKVGKDIKKLATLILNACNSLKFQVNNLLERNLIDRDIVRLNIHTHDICKVVKNLILSMSY